MLSERQRKRGQDSTTGLFEEMVMALFFPEFRFVGYLLYYCVNFRAGLGNGEKGAREPPPPKLERGDASQSGLKFTGPFILRKSCPEFHNNYVLRFLGEGQLRLCAVLPLRPKSNKGLGHERMAVASPVRTRRYISYAGSILVYSSLIFQICTSGFADVKSRSLSSGTGYAFGLIASPIAERLHLSATSINLVGIMHPHSLLSVNLDIG